MVLSKVSMYCGHNSSVFLALYPVSVWLLFLSWFVRMLEVKYADDIEVKVIVVHPNSYPHFPAASIHTAILCNWKGTVLVSRQFIVTIEEVHPVWAAWGEVAFRFLLELRSSFLESNWVNIVHNCTHNVPLNISSWTCLRFLCKALYPRSLPAPYISCLKTIAIS